MNIEKIKVDAFKLGKKFYREHMEIDLSIPGPYGGWMKRALDRKGWEHLCDFYEILIGGDGLPLNKDWCEFVSYFEGAAQKGWESEFFAAQKEAVEGRR